MLIPHYSSISHDHQGTESVSYHLLANHDDARSLSCTTDARNGGQLHKTREDISILRDTGFGHEDVLLSQKSMGIVQVAGSLDRRHTEAQERPVMCQLACPLQGWSSLLVRLHVFLLLH